MCSHVDLWMTVSMAGAMTVDNHCTAGRGMARDAALPHREGCRYAESVLEMLHLKPALKPASQSMNVLAGVLLLHMASRSWSQCKGPA